MSNWYQQQLLSAEVLECNIRLGIIPSTDHAQVLVELKDPLSGVLVAEWSMPHAKWDTWPHMLDTAISKAREFLAQSLEPF